jgi:hypothetical protein
MNGASGGFWIWLGLMFAGCAGSWSINNVADAIHDNHATCVCGKGAP